MRHFTRVPKEKAGRLLLNCKLFRQKEILWLSIRLTCYKIGKDGEEEIPLEEIKYKRILLKISGEALAGERG